MTTPIPRPDRARRRAGLAAAALGTLLLGHVGLAPSPAAADPTLTPTRGEPWFGVQPADGSAAAAASALGGDLSLVARSYTYPLDDAAIDELTAQSAESAQLGAASVVTLLPEDLLASNTDDAENLAATLATLSEADGSFFLVRFGPEMNGSWNSWSRLPISYRNKFRAVADAVHDATDEAAMVWAPAYGGGGYPFNRSSELPAGATAVTEEPAQAVGPNNRDYLDTDKDGAVTGLDDPYQPYFPGGEYVDWVGLTIAPDAAVAAGGRGGGGLPPMDDYFLEQDGYATSGPRSTFYVRYAGPPGRPMLLTTGLISRDGAETADPDAAQVWLDQVVQAGDSRPFLGGIVWLDGGELTADAETTTAALTDSELDLGPLTGIAGGAAGAEADPSGEPAPGDPSSTVPPDPALDPRDPHATGAAASDGLDGGSFTLGVVTTLVLGAGAAAVWLRVRRRRAVPPWLR